VRRGEFRQPKGVAVLDIGLWTGAAGTAGPSQGLKVRSGEVVPLLVGPGDLSDSLEIDQTRHRLPHASDDGAVGVEEPQGALTTGVIGKGQIVDRRGKGTPLAV